jgi:drug/metabolite transporter (DMT)-like permease
MNTPWSSRLNNKCLVGDWPGFARYCEGVEKLREAPFVRKWVMSEVVPHISFYALCPFLRTEGFCMMGKGGIPLTPQSKGPFFVAMSAALYSIGGLCIKLIPWNGMAINGARTTVALVVIGLYLLIAHHPLKINRWIFLGALSVCGTNILFALANKMTTAANAIVLQFTVPIFVMLFSALFFHRKPDRVDLIACIVVFGGILFFFLDSLEMGGGLGNVLALFSGVAYAGVFLMQEMPEGDAISSVFWGDVISACTGLPFLLLETEFTPTAVTSLIILGAFQVGLAYVLLCIGLQTTPPVTASLVSGIEPVLNPILVAVFYGEQVGRFALFGATIVVGGVVGYNIYKAKCATSIAENNINHEKTNEKETTVS